MKKMNLVFSGFLASLLLGVGNVNAATSGDPVRIASQKYVDDKETTILENVEQNYAKQETVNQITENVTTVTQQVTQLGNTINNEETGLGAQVDKAVTDASSEKDAVDTIQETVTTLGGDVASQAQRLTTAEGEIDTLQGSVSSLSTSVQQIADAADLATKEDKDNKATTIGADNQSSSTAYPSVGAIVEWTNKKITELSDTGLPVNPDNINDNAIAGSKLENGAVTTDKIADEAVTEDKLSQDLSTTIAGKEDKNNKTQTIDASSTSEQYPSAAAVHTALQGKADTSALENYVTTTDIEEINQNITNVTQQVTQLGDTINNEETGLGAQVEQAVTDVAAAQEAVIGLESSVSSLAETVSQKADAADLAKKEDKDNKIQEITAESTADQYPSAVAVRTALGAKADASAVESITENITNITQQVEQITDPETGLAADVEQLQADIADKASAESVATLEGTVTSQGTRLTTAEGEIDALQTASATHATTTALTEGLALKENVANKATTIGADNQSSPTVYPSVGAIVEWTNKKITELSDTGLPVNPDNINDNSIAGSKLENGAVTTDKIADNAVTQEKLSDDLVSEIAGKANVSDVYTKLETNEKIVELAVPQPEGECMADSGLCVLSVGTDGQFKWVNVTEPAQ